MKHLSRQDMKEIKGGDWPIIGCQVKCQQTYDTHLPGSFIAPVQDCTQLSIEMACWGNGYVPVTESCNCMDVPPIE